MYELPEHTLILLDRILAVQVLQQLRLVRIKPENLSDLTLVGVFGVIRQITKWEGFGEVLK